MDMENKAALREGERLDDLHRNGYRLIQDPKRFCFGVDAVLLSGFAVVKKGETVLDLCTGNGVIPILLCGKTPGKHFTGVEIQAENVDLAKRSVLLNGLSDRVTIDEGDVKDLKSLYPPSSFDVVTANPPYMEAGGGLTNQYGPKTIARHEVLLSLRDVVFGAASMLLTNGRFYMIHRPHRLCDILCTLREARLEPKRLRFVHAAKDKAPSMVLVEAVRGGRPMTKVLPPLIIYGEDKRYTEEIMEIYYGDGCTE